MYRVLLNGEQIGTTALEAGDPPMGVVAGTVFFSTGTPPFQLFLDHCRAHNIPMNSADAEHEFIDTQVIPELHVYREDGVEIAGQGCSITGFTAEGFEVTIIFVPYPFYEKEFPQHCRAYEERFKA